VFLIYEILIYSNDRDKHITYLNTVLQTMREHQLYGNLEKCGLLLKQAVLLGHAVSKEGMKVNPEGENYFRVAKTNRYHWD